MLKLTSKAYRLPLKHPFTISRYTVEIQETVIVTISDGTHSGYGEATANPYYGSTVDKIKTSVESVRDIVEQSSGMAPDDLWRRLEPLLQDDYFALCALDCAFWDLYGRKNQKKLRSLFSSLEETPMSNYTIGIDDIELMKQKILEKPWPVYKIKLGTEDDISILRELREVTDAVFRVDANCSWNADQTLKYVPDLKALNVEFIEQPLLADDWEGMRYLKPRCELPLIADESCRRYEDVMPCAEGFDGINIKLMKCGGITPAVMMIELAREMELTVMAGCMTESSVGISNLAQIAPLLDAIDADGPLLLEHDIAEGVFLENGRIIYSEKNGSGAVLK
ncbi:MAG: dipeptide epimerase [Flavobacteriaceae bacterium]|nr:dipeptide epimerase [Flavobacteriaceae bacterium]